MPKLTDFVWLILVNVLGFFTFGIMFYLAYFTGTLPMDLPEAGQGTFYLWFSAGTLWAWLAGLLVSIGYLFARKKGPRRAMLWAPVYVPVLYSFLALLYFN
jgi:hypothetical protein